MNAKGRVCRSDFESPVATAGFCFLGFSSSFSAVVSMIRPCTDLRTKDRRKGYGALPRSKYLLYTHCSCRVCLQADSPSFSLVQVQEQQKNSGCDDSLSCLIISWLLLQAPRRPPEKENHHPLHLTEAPEQVAHSSAAALNA